MIRTAAFDPTGRYRYTLRRVWDESGPLIAWIMLNPSTADERQDDPTIRRCIGFSRLWGYGGLVILNLFAYRSTDPKALLAVDKPVGPENDRAIKIHAIPSSPAVAAWGNGPGNGVLVQKRAAEVASMLSRNMYCKGLVCLGKTAAGQPKHPLYLPASTKLEPL